MATIPGPNLEIKSSEGFVYSAGRNLQLECVYKNLSKGVSSQPTVPHHRLYPIPRLVHLALDREVLHWTHNNKTFSLRNRRRSVELVPCSLSHSISNRVRSYWTGETVVSLLSIKSAIISDSGNYSCHLPFSNTSTTVQLTIIKGI